MKGCDVTLYVKQENGTDPFGNPDFKVEAVTVKNVLIAPVSADDVDGTHLTDMAVFQLGIPKGDQNVWKDATVVFTLLGETYTGKVVGVPEVGIEDMVPTKWHKKVRVECYV